MRSMQPDQKSPFKPVIYQGYLFWDTAESLVDQVGQI
jgi:hypothetical protein